MKRVIASYAGPLWRLRLILLVAKWYDLSFDQARLHVAVTLGEVNLEDIIRATDPREVLADGKALAGICER